MKTSIIIPVHNQWQLLSGCIDSVLESSNNAKYQIIIVNDGSDQETTRYCKKLLDIKKIQKLIHNTITKGFSESCNLGIKESQDCDYICLLNSDTKVVTKDWLDKVISCGETDKKIACLGVLSNSASSQSVGKFFIKEKEINEYGDWVTTLSEKRYPKTKFVNGFCFFIKTSIQQQIGFLDIDVFPHYGSEDDFSLRVQEKGFKLIIVDDVYVYHYSNQSYKDRRYTIITSSFHALSNKWGESKIKEYAIEASNVLNYLKEKIYCLENTPKTRHVQNKYKQNKIEENKVEEQTQDCKIDKNTCCDIIIPVFNALHFLKKCIDSIKKYTEIKYNLIIVDNNSTYETKEYLKTIDATVVFNNKNYGFSYAVNQGLELSKSPNICILNSDTIVTNGWLSNLIYLLEKEHAGLIGPVTNFAFSNLQQISVSYSEFDNNVVQTFAKERVSISACFETNKLIGFCLVTKQNILKQIGNFDDRFRPGCFEDDDICLRFIERGYKVICAQGIFIHHFGGESFNQFKNKSNDALETNKMHFVNKWYESKRINTLYSKIQPLKIIYLLASDGPSGGVKIVFEQANRLKSRGHDVKIICSFKESKEKWFDCKVPIIYDNLRNIPSCDVLIGSYFTTLQYLTNADAKVKIHLCQGYEALLYSDHKILETINNGYNIVKNKIVVSKWLKDIINKKLNMESLYIPNAIDSYVFSFERHKRNIIPRILIIGSEQLQFKGVEVAISAIIKLEKKINIVRLSTFEQQNNLKCEYYDMTKMTQEQIANVYNSCDITICASEKVEGFSLPPLESMASGTPVITTDNGGVNDYAVNNENCIITSPSSFCHNIELLLNNENVYNKLADNGIATAKKYLWHNTIDKIEKHFHDLVNECEKTKTECLSICMIVKNEENWLEQCLESVKILASEIIIVDTGSTDNTIRIAKKFGANIYHYTWDDDFSKARNFALEKVTKQFVLILDADECISKNDLQKIKDAIRKNCAYSFITRNYVDDVNTENIILNDNKYKEQLGIGWCKSEKIRLFPINKHIKFEGKVHELVENSINKIKLKIKSIDVPIHHYGYLKHDVKKDKKYLELGKEKFKQTNNLQSVVELAKQYTSLNNFDEALVYWRKALEFEPQNYEFIAKMGTTYNLLEDFEKAEECFLKSIKITGSDYTYKHLGICYAKTGNYQKAYECFKEIVYKEHDFKTMADFSFCCNFLKKYDEAISVLEKCLKINREKTVSCGLLEEAYNEKGIELAKKNKLRLSYSMFKSALEINPDFKKAKQNIQELEKVLK